MALNISSVSCWKQLRVVTAWLNGSMFYSLHLYNGYVGVQSGEFGARFPREDVSVGHMPGRNIVFSYPILGGYHVN